MSFSSERLGRSCRAFFGHRRCTASILRRLAARPPLYHFLRRKSRVPGLYRSMFGSLPMSLPCSVIAILSQNPVTPARRKTTPHSRPQAPSQLWPTRTCAHWVRISESGNLEAARQKVTPRRSQSPVCTVFADLL